MKRPLHVIFVAALPLWAFAVLPLCRAAYAADAEAVDGIAAIVNGDVITYSQVRAVSAAREKVLRAQYTGEELVNKIKEAQKAALQDLIDRQLILQAFKKEHYEIPDHYVDERMHEIIRESFGGDRNTFVKTLEAQNYTLGEFKKLETERMIVQAMRSKNVKHNMAVSPTKIEEYYRAHRNEFTSKEEIKLRMIMIPSRADTGNAAAQKAMAEEILGKLANGANFERLAQIYSEDSTRELGGDWGWIERKTLAAPLEQVAFNLPVGRISRIIDYNGNYYILRVEDKRGGETKPLSQVREEIEKKLMQLEAQQLQEKWLASLRSKAYIRTF
ncbi:MAG TPA: peptidylprolyl isomerase [Chthoniobacterales bacterium]|jgi:peptidyl-prolyl cis-trans isomerase SurA|nr:peptidylprolyl isomerase [Chthoniobacterales bacterium]